ncbi:MAG: cysteine desulfurase [Bacteroides sp.]|nr:cysteine desulfurase [Bacteroides sp.]MCM1379037.1 cysteine desulfurase [Bacteroides sp.]MCM1445653.1 cysteine desulfurase [Prevotella sp.]
MLNVDQIRAQFPALDRQLYGRQMVYLDNVATSQTPREVVNAISAGYFGAKANVHRGVHTLSQEATALQEQARERIRQWLNATSTQEIIFTRGTTEAINLVASSYCKDFGLDDEIIITVMEHHANIVPWQLQGVKLRVVPILADGSLDLDAYRSLFNEHTRLAAFCHVSNVLGTVNPIAEMIAEAHAHGVPALIDGAQAVAHIRPDVRTLNADFYAFSLHKMYGPTGVGVLYGRKELLEKMPPYQGGGEMISRVSFDGTTFAELPYKFEAGTPDFVGISAISPTLDFINGISIDQIAAREHELLEYATAEILKIPEVRIYGTAPGKGPVISFNVSGAHHYDVGMLLDKQGIEVRTGHHCAQPLMHALGIEGTVRLGFAVYNTIAEVDAFIAALRKTIMLLC